MILRPRAVSLTALALTALLFRGNAANSQSLGPLLLGPAESKPTAAVATATPADKRAENAEQLRVAQRRLEGDPADAAAAEEVARLKTSQNILAQQEAIDQQVKDLEARRGEVEKQLKDFAANAESETSISFIRFDRMVNQLAAEKSRIELAEARAKAATAAFESAQSEADAREKERQKAQEAAEVGKDKPEAEQLAKTAEQAARARALAADTVSLRQKELEREKLAVVVQRLTVEQLEKRIDQLRPLVVFTEADLQDQLKKLTAQEEALRRSLRTAEAHLPTVQSKLTAAKWRGEVPAEERWLAAEQLDALRRDKERTQDEINVYLAQLLQLDQLRTAWTRLYRLVASAPPPTAEELATWDAETSATLKALIGSTQAHLFRIDELRNELATLADKAEAAKEGHPPLREAIARQQQTIERMLRVHEANLVSIDTSRRLHGKLRTEINNGAALLSFDELVRSCWRQFENVWGYGIYSTEYNGSTRLITFGKVVNVLVLFVVGLVLSRRFSTFLANRLLRRLRLSKDSTAVIRTIVFYTLLTSITLAALHRMNVPLTAFTILGGALAIGVGFGSQNLVSNFISGLIMLAERPVRIGERVLFGKYDGVIEDVGFRCTKLRTGTDHLVTIPNSALINDSIENVGRRRTIRRTMNLGITYDTPREKVLEAVEAIRELLAEPGIREPIHPLVGWDKFPPRVFFQDYTADSLNLQVTYWFAPADHWEYMEHAQRVNLRIYEEFERLGVSFAFPSRTLYLAGDGVRQIAAGLAGRDVQTPRRDKLAG